MINMLKTQRFNSKDLKTGTVYTPEKLSNYIFELLKDRFDKKKDLILDPCVGKGSLIDPWKKAGFKTKSYDIENQGYEGTIEANYLALKAKEKPGLVLMNPPFVRCVKNSMWIKKTYHGDIPKLLPELFLERTYEKYGDNVPIVMFAGITLISSHRHNSRRLKKFVYNHHPKITSLIILPVDTFEKVNTYPIILIFNIKDLNPINFWHDLPIHKIENVDSKNCYLM